MLMVYIALMYLITQVKRPQGNGDKLSFYDSKKRFDNEVSQLCSIYKFCQQLFSLSIM